jgi:hypothetical protein
MQIRHNATHPTLVNVHLTAPDCRLTWSKHFKLPMYWVSTTPRRHEGTEVQLHHCWPPIRWRLVTGFTLCRFTSGKSSSALTGVDCGWASEAVWTLRKILSLPGIESRSSNPTLFWAHRHIKEWWIGKGAKGKLLFGGITRPMILRALGDLTEMWTWQLLRSASQLHYRPSELAPECTV